MQKTKAQQLLALKNKMRKDESLPLAKGATKLVFGDGDPESKVLFIGEGPGYWEDVKGLPFVGNAGALLNQALSAISMARESVYITNVVHHRPPGNRDPQPNELTAYGFYLDKMIETIDPELIVTLGRFSLAKFLGDMRISSVHGKVFHINWGAKELCVVPMYHPAAALRSSDIKEKFFWDFRKIPGVLENIEKERLEKKNQVEQMSLV